MHWLDRIAGIITARPRLYEPVFADGWGDAPIMERYRARAHVLPPPTPLDITWDDPVVRPDGLYERDGSFPSPGIDLPAASATARFRVVSAEPQPRRLCLLMASFNDHGYAARMKLAMPLTRFGVGAVLLENPYYGTRRPVQGQPIRTVVDLLVMGSAAVLEGRALLLAFRNEGIAELGVSGYSMGGNIATFISSVVPFPVATAGLAASHSPAPIFADGILSRAVAWDALGGIPFRDELRRTLGIASTLYFDPPAHQRAAILANPGSDGYIPRRAFEDLHAHWPRAQLRWITGGHASVLMWRREHLVRAILDSFERLRYLWPGT
jgi:hypothetical protein